MTIFMWLNALRAASSSAPRGSAPRRARGRGRSSSRASWRQKLLRGPPGGARALPAAFCPFSPLPCPLPPAFPAPRRTPAPPPRPRGSPAPAPGRRSRSAGRGPGAPSRRRSSRHCSGVGSMPLGLWQQPWSRMMSPFEHLPDRRHHAGEVQPLRLRVVVGVGRRLEARRAEDADVVRPGRIADPDLRPAAAAVEEVARHAQSARAAGRLGRGAASARDDLAPFAEDAGPERPPRTPASRRSSGSSCVVSVSRRRFSAFLTVEKIGVRPCSS